MSSDFVLVTGASGFLGSHVVDQLVKAGDRVRGTVRTAKVARFQEAYDGAYGVGRVEIVGIDDLVQGDFGLALKDITAVIHVASPLSGRTDPKSTLDAAIDGTMNVIHQAHRAGVKKYGIASSISAAIDPKVDPPVALLKESDWNMTTREEALEPGRDNIFVYGASKALAEKAVWKLADEHPDVHVTTLNPTFFIGPYAPALIINPGDVNAMSTNLVLYNILLPDSKMTTPIHGFVDVRDVARGLIAGIKTPGRHRALLSGEWFELQDAVDYIAAVRPALKNRLPKLIPTGQTQATVDNTVAEEALKLKVRSWRDSVLEVVDTLIRLEREWVDAGIDLDSTMRNTDRRA